MTERPTPERIESLRHRAMGCTEVRDLLAEIDALRADLARVTEERNNFQASVGNMAAVGLHMHEDLDAARADATVLAAECRAWRAGQIKMVFRDVRHPDGDEDDRMTVPHIIDSSRIAAATDASAALSRHGGGA